MEKRLPNPAFLFPTIICVVLAICSLFVVHLQSTKWSEFKQNAQETTAVITDIKTKRTRNGTRKRKTKHIVNVRYTVDGQEYNTRLNYYSSGMHEGGEVKLYYDPENPSETMSDPTVSNIVLSVLGVIFLIVGFAIPLSELKRCVFANRLIANNNFYLCDDWVEETAPVTVNGVRYHQITCRIVDDRGNEYTYRSQSFNPSKSPYKAGDKIKIYVDLFEDPTNYYISKNPVRDEYL